MRNIQMARKFIMQHRRDGHRYGNFGSMYDVVRERTEQRRGCQESNFVCHGQSSQWHQRDAEPPNKGTKASKCFTASARDRAAAGA
jgi:hypothetical protein